MSTAEEFKGMTQEEKEERFNKWAEGASLVSVQEIMESSLKRRNRK